MQHHLRPDDDTFIGDLVALARNLGLGYVATNNVHYAQRRDQLLQDVLVCIRQRVTLDEAGPLLRDNSECYLKPYRRLQPLFAAYPEALANTLRIAERCHFELQYGLQDLPDFPTPVGLSPTDYLEHLCHQAISNGYAQPTGRLWHQLGHELSIIDHSGLSNYFLIVWDIVRYARQQGILCQGRGSAANSLVAYLLDISPIDPLAHNLVFERFLAPERGLPPDIDLDIQADRREEAIQYVYQRYGPEHAAMACTFVTFRSRSAVRDIGQVLGVSEPLLLQAADLLRERREAESEDNPIDLLKTDALEMLVYLCQRIHGFPRHVGLHNGGMVVTQTPLSQRVPPDRPPCPVGWWCSGIRMGWMMLT